ncbi:T9SS type A sorting domain-containing protein [Winogradskyella thalassocola]|uniref:Por secretion system C-terminal sorting domain-containing protein n=1 Tax=Winogradskyella thalassocola TaxID=262004 RepID=A0A1G8L4F0_9FLAO|nr:T9SS type A sorting domain-containing protein [Winogradskyella thalassocola]SDI50583.1 Por secretion system C-terminal sorting domain-containing protein [Winogradskyella thalassocola]
MKLSLSSFLLLCCSISFAQLSVQNDAYVFVKNQSIYVTDDVNIDDADSKIYLRDEAQLLQGNGTTGNSGNGQLSVYQTGTVNQWSYNYWCSPIGNNSAAFGNEDARVNLIDDATGLISSADALFTSSYDGSSSPLTISQRWLWTYQTSDQYLDWVFVGATGNIKPGLGFTMKGNGTGLVGSQIYDFRGKPNNGTITNDVANGLNTLVGNPYPSAMDSAAFIHDVDNQASINGTLQFWEQDGNVPSHVLQDYIGGYSLFTIDAAGAIITTTPAVFFTYDEQDNGPFPLPPGPGGIGTKEALRYIPIGQGFMVEGIAGTPSVPAKVYARNSHRAFAKESDGDSYFFRSNSNDSNSSETTEPSGIQYQNNGLSIIPEDYKRFRINVDFSDDESQYTRQLVLNFHDSATAGFDYGLELIRTESYNSDAYFSLDDKVYSGQAFPFEEALVIPVAINIEQEQPLRFRIFDIQNFDDSQGIYIHDNDTDTYVNLRNLDYELNITPGNYTDRFTIVFTNQALDVEEFDTTALTINQDNNLHQLSVQNPNGLDINTIAVYDVTGKRMIQVRFDAVEDLYNLSTLRLSDGVYVVNVTSHANTTAKSQKIIVKN